MKALLVLLLATSARAATIVGTDYNGADLAPSNGDVLQGTFTNVGHFYLPEGATAYVAAGIPFAVYAQTVTISGAIDAVGRGEAGGGGGAPLAAGLDGFGVGGGTHANAGNGGGGAGHAGFGGDGGGTSGSLDGTGGRSYGSTGTLTIPISIDDAMMGSGGGGGGGGSAKEGSTGGAGGGIIYIEASSVTISGTLDVSGSTAPPSSEAGATGNHPGGGGGGSGGTLIVRAVAGLTVSGRLFANGGGGGNAQMLFSAPSIDPGGGGSGGRIKLFGLSPSYSVFISTHVGSAGTHGGFGGTLESPAPTTGSSGTASFGLVASAPGSFAAGGVYVTSISWTWSAPASFGDGPTTAQYRIFPGTATAPLVNPESQTSTAVAGSTVASLTPNTTYYRFVTAYTDWGDSRPSNGATAYTLADVPALAAQPFPSASAAGLTFSWTNGTAGNPSYTQYEVSASSVAGFGVSVSTTFVVGTSSAASGLTPNTTYYFRARAVNLAGVQTAFTATAATATWAATPSSQAFGRVFVTSMSVVWSAGGNPADTRYDVEVSSDNFFSVSQSSRTLMTSATFFSLAPGQQFYFRVSALNRHDVRSAYSAVISTTGGNVSDLTPPSSPGAPVSDKQFSYDGVATFAWTPATHGVGILDYHLIVGTLPGAADVLNDQNVLVASRSIAGLASGRSYYAQVRARANNGVYSGFSSVSAGLPVFDTTVAAKIDKPYAWPSPFDPRTGPAQIGFSMPEAGTVVIKIYTLSGRLVHEQSREFPAGNQIASWSGQNGTGSRVAPGGYIVMIQKKMGGKIETQKMKLAVLY